MAHTRAGRENPRRPLPKSLVRAFARLGSTPEDQARWLLRAAYSDPARMTQEDWLSLQEEIGAFLFLDPTDNLFYGHGIKEAVSREVAEDCIRVLRDGLRDLVREGKCRFDTPTVSRVAEWHRTSGEFRWRTTLPYKWTPRGGRWFSQTMDWSGYFLLRVYDVLRAAERRFRICPDCRRAFIARKRQAYCSPRCSQNVRTKKYRFRHRARLKKQRHAAYERKMKAALGAKVKVARRAER